VGDPALVVMFLGGMAWISSHDLDPPRPIASQVAPVQIQVVALMEWLFIYPDQGVAGRQPAVGSAIGAPLSFRITSAR